MNPIISQGSDPSHQAPAARSTPVQSPPRRRDRARCSRLDSGIGQVPRAGVTPAGSARGEPESSTTPPRAVRRRSAPSQRQGHARKEVWMTRSFAGGMPQTTIVLVFRDSCGCSPFLRIRLRRGHQGGRSIASGSRPVKTESRHPAPGRLGRQDLSQLFPLQRPDRPRKPRGFPQDQ